MHHNYRAHALWSWCATTRERKPARHSWREARAPKQRARATQWRARVLQRKIPHATTKTRCSQKKKKFSNKAYKWMYSLNSDSFIEYLIQNYQLHIDLTFLVYVISGFELILLPQLSLRGSFSQKSLSPVTASSSPPVEIRGNGG